MAGIHRFRMLVVGSQLPYHDGYDISPERARKWAQRGHASSRNATTLPTIVGVCDPLPPDEWDRFTHGVAISGILELEGNPNHAVLHGATWYFDVDLGDSQKRFKAYGISAMEVLKGEEWEDMGVWSAGLAASEVDYFNLRVPWQERLEMRGVQDYAEALADLASISGEWNQVKFEPIVDWRLRTRILKNRFAARLNQDGLVDEDLWSDLISALHEVREPWRHARAVDKELIAYLLNVIAAIHLAKDRAAQENETDLVADFARRQSDLYRLLADLLKLRSPQPG